MTFGGEGPKRDPFNRCWSLYIWYKLLKSDMRSGFAIFLMKLSLLNALLKFSNNSAKRLEALHKAIGLARLGVIDLHSARIILSSCFLWPIGWMKLLDRVPSSLVPNTREAELR